ncbi:MAG: aldehyde-activating protein [Pseudomonadota bacterium]
MPNHKLKASCHCGRIRLDLELSRPPESYSPRACDCDFCRKHGAAYLSDAAGALRIYVKDVDALSKYRQGSDLADCLFCRYCGVLLGVAYQDGAQLYAVINSRVIDGGICFAEPTSVSPKTLAASEKVGRWKAVWFADVVLILEPA